MIRLHLVSCLIALAALSACSSEPFSDDEKKIIAQLRLSELGSLEPDQSNRFADDPAAAAFGARLFVDARLSANGFISCASCHDPERQFQDDEPLGKGIGTSTRRTMPLAGAAHGDWFMWDGAKDSQWAQALVPLEDPREHGFSRAGVAQLIAEVYRTEYEAVFGALPEVGGQPDLPQLTLLERDQNHTRGEAEQDQINRVFANVGKSLAAFQRTISLEATRFDRYAAIISDAVEADDRNSFNSLEIEGLKLFIGKAGCIECHNGPRFTDDFFHNTGVPRRDEAPADPGRSAVLESVVGDPFNCLGPYSDAQAEECHALRFMVRDEAAMKGAFKTPSLRGVASRAPYMHAGQLQTLEEVIQHYSDAPAASTGTSEISPITFTDRGRAALIAFLKTLE